MKNLKEIKEKQRKQRETQELNYQERYVKVRAHALLQKKSAALSQFDSDRGLIRRSLLLTANTFDTVLQWPSKE